MEIGIPKGTGCGVAALRKTEMHGGRSAPGPISDDEITVHSGRLWRKRQLSTLGRLEAENLQVYEYASSRDRSAGVVPRHESLNLTAGPCVSEAIKRLS